MTFSRSVILILAVCFLSVGFVNSADAKGLSKKTQKRYLQCIEQGEDACNRESDVCPEKYHKECIGKWQTGEIAEYSDFIKKVENRFNKCKKSWNTCMAKMLDECNQIVKPK